MSIVQLNIRTRIELETRVLAAALKQSFERGDSDGVSLAHRQLFLLLKDQKAGNGSTTAEAAPVETNGETYSADSHEVIYDYDSSATTGPESTLDEAEGSRYQEQAYEDQDAGQSEPELPEYEQSVIEPDESDPTENEQPEFAPLHDDQSEELPPIQGATDDGTYEEQHDYEAAEDFEHAQVELREVGGELTNFTQAENVPVINDQSEYDEPSFVPVIDQSAYAEPDFVPVSDQSEYAEPRFVPVSDQSEYAEPELVEEESDPLASQTQAEVPPFQGAGRSTLPGYQSSPESETRNPAGSLGKQTPEQAHAIAQYLKYKQTREQFDSVDRSDKSHSSEPTSDSGAHEAALEPAAQDTHEARPLTEEEEYIRMRKPAPPKKVELPFDHQSAEYAEIFGSSIIGSPQEQQSVPVSEIAPDSSPFQNTAQTQSGPFDAIPEPPSFGQFENRSSTFGSSADLPPELRQPPTQAFPKISPVLQTPAEELPKVRQKTTQDLPQVPEFPDADQGLTEPSTTADAPDILQTRAQDLAQESTPEVSPAPADTVQEVRKAAQNATQDLPQIGASQMLDEIRGQQAAEYAERKASQSIPRKMPAIDFSLQSEVNAESQEPAPQPETKPNLPNIDFSLESEKQPGKPDIDFSLEAEKQPSKPDIDFSLEAEKQPSKPDIDFSIQSKTKPSKPDIDFSLEAEKQADADGPLNAPAGGGFIEAEFVSSDSESSVEHKQDITSELPVVNPSTSLYLDAQDVPTPATLQRPHVPSSAEPPTVEVPADGSMPTQSVVPTPSSTPTVTPPAEAPAADEITGQEVPLAPAAPKPPDLYAMLGVSQMSPFEEIHKNFLRKIRKILLKLKTAVRPERDELLKELRRNWVARDILCDPVTRTDYDFRDMGLRGSPDAPVPHVEEPQRIGQRTPLRIGELLQCAGLLEQAELEIACDMHKAMPEVQFGTFLVRQGFIQERDLDSVLLGQTLLRDGKITVAQFQVAMELSQSRGANISDTLIDHGYITAAELAQLTEKSAEASDAALPVTPQIKEVPVKPRPAEPPAQNLNTSSAVPTWKDQLDWSKPLPVDDDASLIDRNPEKQSLADLLVNVKNEPASEPEVLKISNNAAPSWKDQLDWHQPQESESDTTDSATRTTEQSQQQEEEAQPSLSIANAVPSWKDQLDWEQPKEETATSEKQASTHASQSAEHLEEEEEEEEPIIHGSKETQPISIYPPTSVAPNITLGKGNSSTASDTEFKHDSEASQSSKEQSISAHVDQQTTGELEAHDDESHDDEPDSGDDEPAGHENEGFFKRNLNKLKKGDPKDKKKKRK